MSVSRVKLKCYCSSCATPPQPRLEAPGEKLLDLLGQFARDLAVDVLAETNSNFLVAKRVGKCGASVDFYRLGLGAAALRLAARGCVGQLTQYHFGCRLFLAAGE